MFEDLKKIVGEHYVLAGHSPSAQKYLFPERGAVGQSPLILRPGNIEEIKAILKHCQCHKQALVISAGRTGLVEAQRPEGEVVLDLSRLNRLLALYLPDGTRHYFSEVSENCSLEERMACWRKDLEGITNKKEQSMYVLEAEAGVSVGVANKVLEELGLTIPIEMASSMSATLGACVANNTAAASALLYGTASDQCLGLTGVWANGDEVVEEELPEKEDSLLKINSAIFPYGNETLLGSQGALGVIVSLKMVCQAIPAHQEVVLLALNDLGEGMSILKACEHRFPVDVEQFEFISATAMSLVRQQHGEIFERLFASHPNSAVLDAPYYFMLQLKSEEEQAEALLAFLLESGVDEKDIGYSDQSKYVKWLRHGISESSNVKTDEFVLKQQRDERENYRLALDVAVPLDKVKAFSEALNQWVEGQPLLLLEFGHVGVGAFHLHFIRQDGEKLGDMKQLIVDRVFDYVAGFGGTFSAEHGVGSKWAEEFFKRTEASRLRQMGEAMRRFDPAGILNPRCFSKNRLMRL